ncbi:putative reverse transcriptase domain-containing protein, partial [Tanacetum coccineum]
RSRQKSYADKRRKPLEFQVGDRVLLKVSPWKGVVPLDEIEIDENLRFVEEPIEIVEQDVKKLKQRRIPLVKVCWNSRQGAEYTWEHEDQFRMKYRHLFSEPITTRCGGELCSDGEVSSGIGACHQKIEEILSRPYNQRDDPTSKVTPDPEKPSDQMEAMESSRSKEKQTPAVPIDKADTWKLYIDGASNDHRSGARLILIDPEGLRIEVGLKVKKMHAFMDSKLVANQVEGPYEARGEKTKKYKEKLAAFQCEGLTKRVLVEEPNERSVGMAEVNVIVEEEGRTWMTPIMEYIEKGTLPEDIAEARTIRVKVHPTVLRLPKDDMIPVTSAWPFRKCGMDIVSPLPEDLGRLKYLMVAIDYFIKWLEAKPVASMLVTLNHFTSLLVDRIQEEKRRKMEEV